MPNQHGAWAMLSTPAVAGVLVALLRQDATTLPRLVVTLALILGAWFSGYFCFFAFGQWVKARNPHRKHEYAVPMAVTGAMSLACIVIVVLLAPCLLWFAPLFAPLVLIAVAETLRHRPRSLLSGVSTTCASALLLPALYLVGEVARSDATRSLAGIPASQWAATAFLAAYFTGTIPFVKTMVRERGKSGYLVGSVAYHAVVVVAVLFLGAGRIVPVASWWLMIVVAVWALVRATTFPLTLHRWAWTPKQIGVAEVPLCILAGLAVLFAG
ncbi:YwiC-like family protein [Corynebacterium vitaeruminis]|nr:YwiC-like family protein [Corynebacterium vitaeruminis]